MKFEHLQIVQSLATARSFYNNFHHISTVSALKLNIKEFTHSCSKGSYIKIAWPTDCIASVCAFKFFRLLSHYQKWLNFIETTYERSKVEYNKQIWNY